MLSIFCYKILLLLLMHREFQCFSSGAEVDGHLKSHQYIIVVSTSIICVTISYQL